jgi:CheY-like chemotaxis protein
VRVLIVDDEPDARELAARVLAESGANALLVSNVADALSALGRDAINVLVSDIGMPGRDGYDLSHAVRQKYDAKTIPAVALTAFAGTEARIRALGADFQLHIAKPVDPHQLSLAVASLVGRTGA